MISLSKLFLGICLISVSFFVRSEELNYLDFTEDEYRVIAKIITKLTYDVPKDEAMMVKLPLYERTVWNAFIWRFYRAHGWDKDLYFPKIAGLAGEKSESEEKDLLKQVYKERSSSVLVLAEALFLAPQKYSDLELDWIADILQETQDQELHDATFFILLIRDYFHTHTDHPALKTLSQKEIELIEKQKKSSKDPIGSSQDEPKKGKTSNLLLGKYHI